MKKSAFLMMAALMMLVGCSSKPELKAPLCPTSGKGEEPINDLGLPPVVSDDGRFTHVKFGIGQEVPNFTALRIDGKERRVDYNFDPSTRVATVFGIYPAIVLRVGERVACIRNAAYDPRNPQSRAINVGGDGKIW